MAGTELRADKITHPFQLMAAWFVMLILLDGALLETALRIGKPSWAAGFLVISAVGLSVIVMAAVFMMLTRFRPHLQDSKEYATWLREERKFKGESISQLVVRQPASLLVENAAVSTVHTNSEVSIQRVTTTLEAREMAEPVSVEDNGESEENAAGQPVIEVVDIPGAKEIVRALKGRGLDAGVYTDSHGHSKSAEEHCAVWIGYRVDPRVAVRAIKASIRIWPQLTYLHLSSDSASDPPSYIHDEVFIGGATQTAKRYGLLRWDPVDFATLKESMSTKKFHELIRSKYSREATEM